MKGFEPKKQNNLEQVLASLKDMQEVNPDSAFRKNGRIRLLNQITPQPIPQRLPAFFTKPFQFALATLLIFLLGCTGTVFAAQSSLPTDALYPVKTASERVLLTISPPYYKGKVALLIADRRVNELKSLNALGRNNQIPDAVSAYERSIKQIQKVDHLSQDEVNQHLANNQQVLQEVLQKVSAQAKPAIENAINASDNAKGVGNVTNGRNNNPRLQKRKSH
ncbi:MAG: hypothetical protein NVS1B13_26810 [Flavisolibacter sp.]